MYTWKGCCPIWGGWQRLAHILSPHIIFSCYNVINTISYMPPCWCIRNICVHSESSRWRVNIKMLCIVTQAIIPYDIWCGQIFLNKIRWVLYSYSIFTSCWSIDSTSAIEWAPLPESGSSSGSIWGLGWGPGSGVEPCDDEGGLS